MNRVNLLISKVDELRAAKEAVARIERELGELVGDEVAPGRAPGKMPVAAPAALQVPAELPEMPGAVSAKFAEARNGRVAQKDFPAEGVESLPHKLVRVVNESGDRTWTPREVAEAIGEEFRKTHASLLHRAARKGLIAKKGAGVFGPLKVKASKKNGKKAA